MVGATGGDDRQRVMDAAWSLVARVGLRGLKLENVLAASGLSTRAFYRCFADKDDLLRALAAEHYGRLAARTREILWSVADPLEGIRLWVDYMLDIEHRTAESAAGAAILRHWTELRAKYPEAVVDAIRPLHTALKERLEELQRGGADHVSPHSDAAAILLLTKAVFEQRLLARPPLTRDTAREIVWPFVRRTLTLQAESPSH